MTARDELARELADFLGQTFARAYDDPTITTIEEPVADALIAAGWRKMPSRSDVAEWVSGNFVVSNGTQAWVEFQGSIDGFTDAILALMDAHQ